VHRGKQLMTLKPYGMQLDVEHGRKKYESFEADLNWPILLTPWFPSSHDMYHIRGYPIHPFRQLTPERGRRCHLIWAGLLINSGRILTPSPAPAGQTAPVPGQSSFPGP
jgi:hypothetical protein